MINFVLEPGDLPTDPQPSAPAHHVESHACGYGSIGYPNDVATWNACDCEDPANPWPSRLPTDGQIDCDCSLCSGKPRVERGREPCEYAAHHCDNCHERKTCTTIECKKEFT